MPFLLINVCISQIFCFTFAPVETFSIVIMGKKYKVISDFGSDVIFVERFETLEKATRVFNKSIKDDAYYVYLLEVLMSYSSGDSCEKVVSFFKH